MSNFNFPRSNIIESIIQIEIMFRFLNHKVFLQIQPKQTVGGIKYVCTDPTARVQHNIFKNILLYVSSRLSKIRSVHTYIMPRTVYFGWICNSIFFKNIVNVLPEIFIFSWISGRRRGRWSTRWPSLNHSWFQIIETRWISHWISRWIVH